MKIYLWVLSCFLAPLFLNSANLVAQQPTPQNQERESKPVDFDLDQLVGWQWEGGRPGAFGYGETLELYTNQQYHWNRQSDATERDDRGAWALVPHNEVSGVIRMEESGDVPFMLLDKDTIWVGGTRLQRGDRLDPEANPQPKDESNKQKDIEPLEFTRRLAETVWVKTNNFDDFYLPDRLTFRLDGSYEASYRNGECKNEGVWGLMVRERFAATEYVLTARAMPNDCDLRGWSASLTTMPIRFEGSLLKLTACYAPEGEIPDESIFIFDRYGGSMQTRGEFDGPLQQGQEVELQLSMTSRNGEEFSLRSLEIGFQPMKKITRGFAAAGEKQQLVNLDLTGKKVTPDRPAELSVKFTPPFRGKTAFLIRIRYSSPSQEWDGNQYYLVEIK